MTLQTAQIETPSNKAPAWNLPESMGSALVAEAKLLGGAPEMEGAFTHAETAEATGFTNHLFMTTLTTGETSFRRVRRRTRPLHPDAAPAEDHLDRANSERLELLARQYVSKDKFTSEEEARLAIVTERVRQLLPSVTVAEFEALERNLEASRQLATKLGDLKERMARLAQKRG